MSKKETIHDIQRDNVRRLRDLSRWTAGARKQLARIDANLAKLRSRLEPAAAK